MDPLVGLALLPTSISLALYVAITVLFARVMRSRTPPRNETSREGESRPRVTILKPLAGDDDELARNLLSFADLTYPNYEILLGVANTRDPALPIARAFVRTNRHIRARIVVTDPKAALNPKVAQLITLADEATGEVLVISDSNVRVAANYLSSLVDRLQMPGVGLVSSLFAGEGERSIGAAIENLQLGSVIAPAVVLSSRIARLPITVGKSMAMRRSDLDAIGGFDAVAGVLAEDHVLGLVFQRAGFRVDVSLDPVANLNVDCSLKRTIERHTRWAKLRRSICPIAFFCEPFLSPIVVATLMTLTAPSRATLAVLGLVAIAESLLAFRSLVVLRGRALKWRFLPLEIVRAYVLFYCWLAACATTRIAWRGHAFELRRDSSVVPARPSFSDRLRAAFARA